LAKLTKHRNPIVHICDFSRWERLFACSNQNLSKPVDVWSGYRYYTIQKAPLFFGGSCFCFKIKM